MAPRRLRSISVRTSGSVAWIDTFSGTQPLGHDPLEVGLGEAGEGGEVPVEERQAVVVVLLVEAAAQTRRQLVDEAEGAVVVAGLEGVEQRRVHLDPERLPGALSMLDRPLEAAAADLQLRVGGVGQHAPADQVAGGLPVDRGDLVAHGQPGARRGRAGRDGDDRGAGTWGSRLRGRSSNAASRCSVASIDVPVDRVLLRRPRGFCAGVEMAIKALAWMVRAFEPPVYCYHEIVHNRLVVERFEQLGVVFVDDIDEVPEGRPIMLSAHGSAPQVVAGARARGSVVVNAVCPLVTKVHHEVKRRAGEGYRILYVGHAGHEEAVGTMAVAPEAIDLVETAADVEALPDDGQSRSPCWPRPRCRTGSGPTWPTPPGPASPTCGSPDAPTCASPRPTARRRSWRWRRAATPSS